MLENEASLNRYFEEVSRVPLLSAAEERDLARRARKGDTEARNDLIEANLRFVVKIAKNYVNQGLSFLDLIQEGNLGLIEGIKRFDPEKGFRLTTYVGWWINLHVQRAVQQKARPVNVPLNKLEILRKVRAYSSDHQRQTGRLPALGQVASALGIPVQKLERAVSHDISFISMEDPICSDGRVVADLMAAGSDGEPERSVYMRQALKLLSRVMRVLSPRERQVIEKRFGLARPGGEPLSLRAVGEEVGLTAEGVRRVEKNAIAKLQRPILRSILRGILSLVAFLPVTHL